MDVMSYLMGKNAGSGGGGGGIPTLDTGTIDMSTLDYGAYIVQGNTNLKYGATTYFDSNYGGTLMISDNNGSKGYVYLNCYGVDSPGLTIHYGFTGNDKNAKHYSYTVPGTSA